MSESESLSPKNENLPPREPTPDYTLDDIAKGLHRPKERKARRYKHKTDRCLPAEHRQSAPKKKIPAPPPKRKRLPKPGEFKYKGGKIQVEQDGFWTRFRLTGMQFKNADGTFRSQLLNKCDTKTPIFVKRVTDNPHDPNAFAVCEAAGGHQLGFIPRQIAAVIAAQIDDGSFVATNAKIEEMLGFSFQPGARIRVDFVLGRKRTEDSGGLSATI